MPALQNRKPQSPFLYVDWFVYQFISEGAESENVSIILCVGSFFFVEFVCKITEQIYEPGNQIDNPSLRELYSNRHSSESENFCALFERVIPKNPLDFITFVCTVHFYLKNFSRIMEKRQSASKLDIVKMVGKTSNKNLIFFSKLMIT